MKTLFVYGHIWDGNVDARFEGELLVSGARIEAVSRGHGELPRADATVVDARECTLMPGLVEAHAHLPFPLVTYFTQMDDLPPEDLLITTLHNARLMLEHGFTSCISAGSPRIRSEITIRNEIDAGQLPGPRLLASTPTLTATDGLNDTGRLHQTVNPCAWVADGADEIRKSVRRGYREGVALIAMGVAGHMERNIESHQALWPRGIRHLIGGDYGVPWQPHGQNAFAIEAFVKYLGYAPAAALRCATRNGSEAMGRSDDLGLLKPGYLADVLLVHGDPTADVARLQDRENLRGVMKDGKFHGTVAGHA